MTQILFTLMEKIGKALTIRAIAWMKELAKLFTTGECTDDLRTSAVRQLGEFALAFALPNSSQIIHVHLVAFALVAFHLQKVIVHNHHPRPAAMAFFCRAITR
jgi:hypothetical protein